MKKLLFATTLIASAIGLHAQGTLSMNTLSASVNARAINTETGQPLQLGEPAGTYVASLYFNVAGTAQDALLQSTNALATFGTSAAQAGYILSSTGGGNRVLPIPGGSDAVVQIRAWSSGFASYETAAAAALGGNPSVFTGRSNPITITLASGIGTPTPLNGLTSYSVSPVPEPSSIALGFLGLGAIVLFRRRK